MFLKIFTIIVSILLISPVAIGQEHSHDESPPANTLDINIQQEQKQLNLAQIGATETIEGETPAQLEEKEETDIPTPKIETEPVEPPTELTEPTEPKEEPTVIEEPPLIKTPPITQPEEEPYIEEVTEPATTEETETATGPKNISIDLVIYVDYQFFDSPDAFKIKYAISMGGNANLATSVIKGDAEVATEVTGFLAKWQQGQCLLDVNISKTPYEISYRQSGEEADLSVAFKKEILETWESTCTFLGGAVKPLKSQGAPEKWIANALTKTSPPLTSLVAKIEANEPSSTTFDIAEYTVIEENIGNAKVKGTGIITIQPATKGNKKGGDEEATPSSSIKFKPPMPMTKRLPMQSAERTSN